MKTIDESSLEQMPQLKQLLTDYCNNMYEENSIPTVENLVAEYNMLAKENRLHELFEAELVKAQALSIYLEN